MINPTRAAPMTMTQAVGVTPGTADAATVAVGLMTVSVGSGVRV
jgi:hypothetical protein